MQNTLRFWGVRGSLPAPGPKTAGVGGNTSCVEVRLGGERVIIDGGTGLRALGNAEAGNPIEATLLFSHMHWDHIQGVPFFAPLSHPGSKVTIVGPVGLEAALAHQMSMPTFPVGMDAFGANISIVAIKPGDRFTAGALDVETTLLNHPSGAIGYRLSCGVAAVTSLCDHEHGDRDPSEAILNCARNAEILIGDSQYLPDEYPSKKGWGHSTYEQLTEIANMAGARTLYLTHHEPMRSDAEIAKIEKRARKVFERTHAAREGGVIALEPHGVCSSSEGDVPTSNRPSSVPRI